MNGRATHPPRTLNISLPRQGAPVAPAPDDQATRLRALMQATARPVGAPRPVRSEPRPQPAPPIRHRSEFFGPRAKVVTFASGKGGVGKTNACVNLAIALSAIGKRTTLLDADLGLANADVICGVTPTKRLEHVVGAPGSRGGDVLAMQRAITTSIRELAIEAPGGFRLIPGAAGIARMVELSHEQRTRLFAGLVELERESDLLLIDASAGLGRDVITFTQIADLAVVVATPEPTSITDAYALIKCALTERPIAQRAHHLRGSRAGAASAQRCQPAPGSTADVPAAPAYARLALVVNQVTDEREALAVHGRIAAACTRFLGYRLPLLGWVAQDARVSAAVRKRRPVLLEAPRARASDDLRRLARALATAVEPETTHDQPRRRGLTRLLTRIVLRGR